MKLAVVTIKGQRKKLSNFLYTVRNYGVTDGFWFNDAGHAVMETAEGNNLINAARAAGLTVVDAVAKEAI